MASLTSELVLRASLKSQQALKASLKFQQTMRAYLKFQLTKGVRHQTKGGRYQGFEWQQGRVVQKDLAIHATQHLLDPGTRLTEEQA